MIWMLVWHWMLHASVQHFLGLALTGGSLGFLWVMFSNISRMIDGL